MGVAEPMALASLLISAAGVGAGVVGQVRQGKAERRSRRDQRDAQTQASAAALDQQRANEEAMRKARKKRPDIMSILAAGMGPSLSPTIFTGAGGAPTSLGQ